MSPEAKKRMEDAAKKWSLGWNPTLNEDEQSSCTMAINFKEGYQAGMQDPDAQKELLEKLPEIILEVLNKYDEEMEGYSYYGSNPGVSRENYKYVVEDVIEKLKAARGK